MRKSRETALMPASANKLRPALRGLQRSTAYANHIGIMGNKMEATTVYYLAVTMGILEK